MIQLALKKDVVLSEVAEYECYVGLVFGVLKDTADELVPIHNWIRTGRGGEGRGGERLSGERLYISLT